MERRASPWKGRSAASRRIATGRQTCDAGEISGISRPSGRLISYLAAGPKTKLVPTHARMMRAVAEKMTLWLVVHVSATASLRLAGITATVAVARTGSLRKNN